MKPALRAEGERERAARVRPPAAPSRHAAVMKQVRQWHWISSAICLVAMLLFAVTGITLNHAGEIEAEPVVSTRDAALPVDAIPAAPADGIAPLPDALRALIARTLDLPLPAGAAAGAEWAPDEVYVALPEPGGDAWLRLDRNSGALRYEHTGRGWIAWLNDLHKGRHTGAVWRLFLDGFAVACVVFCLTGLVLLQLHAGKRPGTWPLVAGGFVLPLLIALFFLH